MIFSNRLGLLLSLSLSFSLFSPLILTFLPLTYFYSSSTSRFLAFHSSPLLAVINPELTVSLELFIRSFLG